jgi:hypothetical protein
MSYASVMGGITREEQRRRHVEKARKMLLDHSEKVMELFLSAIDGGPGWEKLPEQTRANMLLRAMDYQLGKPVPAKTTKPEVKEKEEEPVEEEQRGLEIA